MPTLTLTASSMASYRAGSWSQNEFIQGYYANSSNAVYYGHCWFSATDLATLRSTITTSVVVDSVEFWFERANTSHGSSTATSVKLYCTNITGASGSVSYDDNLFCGVLLGSFSRGQSAWCAISSKQLSYLLNNLNGLCVYHENVKTNVEYSYYVRMNALPKLRVTYHYINSTAVFSTNNVSAGSAITMTINANSTAYAHRVTWSFGSYSAVQSVEAGVTSCSYTIPMEWLNTIPNSTSGTATVYLETISGTTVVGTVGYTFTITVPSAVIPSIGSLTATCVNGSVPASWGVYVQGKSKATVTITGATGIYGSTIASYTITGAGYSTSSSSLTTGFLLDSGNISFMGYVTDSRGRLASASISINVVAYSAPTYTNVAATRCLANGSENDEGTYLKLLAAFTYSSVDGYNSIVCSVRYRQGSSGALSSATTLVNNVPSVVGNGEILIDASYEAVFSLTDALNVVVRCVEAGSAAYTMHLLNGGNGVAFGKAAETPNCVEVNSDWAFYAGGKNLAAITPAMIGAATSGHGHTLAECSGMLEVAKGGTGATTAEAARINLGVTLAALGAAASTHTHAASDIASGTLAAAQLPYKFGILMASTEYRSSEDSTP